MILKNIGYLNENFEVIFHKDIRIENNIIKEIGTDLKSFSDEEIIDGKKLIVMPRTYSYRTAAFKGKSFRC